MSNLSQLKAAIESAIASLANTSTHATHGLVSNKMTKGKLYEAKILSFILERMKTHEGCTILFSPGTAGPRSHIALRAKGGPINASYPYFKLYKNGLHFANVWTDIEFLSLSYCLANKPSPITKGDYHELDVLILEPSASSRPEPRQIYLGVECKNSSYGKDMLRQILGVRRELSMLTGSIQTHFFNWPRATVPAHPPACLVVCSSHSQVTQFARPGDTFGIDFMHVPF